MTVAKTVYPDDKMYEKIMQNMNNMAVKPSFNAWFKMVVNHYFESKENASAQKIPDR